MMLRAMDLAGGSRACGVGKEFLSTAAFFVTAAEKISHDGCACVISESSQLGIRV